MMLLYADLMGHKVASLAEVDDTAGREVLLAENLSWFVLLEVVSDLSSSKIGGKLVVSLFFFNSSIVAPNSLI